jgi:hypothetical protein
MNLMFREEADGDAGNGTNCVDGGTSWGGTARPRGVWLQPE